MSTALHETPNVTASISSLADAAAQRGEVGGYNAVVSVAVLVPIRFTVPVQAADADNACEMALQIVRKGHVAGVRDWSCASPYYVEHVVHDGARQYVAPATTFRGRLRDWLRIAAA